MVNLGDIQFLSEADTRWGVFLGPNIKAIPTALFPEDEQDHGMYSFSGSLAGLDLVANQRVQLSIDIELPALLNASYLSVCALENDVPVYATCRDALQYDGQQNSFILVGSIRSVQPQDIDGVNGVSNLTVQNFPAVVLQSNSRIENESVVGTVFVIEDVPGDFLDFEKDAYRVIAFDPSFRGFIPGLPGDILPNTVPTGDGFDLLGVPDNGVWPALSTLKADDAFDMKNASTATFLSDLSMLPQQMRFCIVSNDNNRILLCTETLIQGFAGPPVCGAGFIVDGSESSNQAACDQLALGQTPSCTADIVGASVLSASETRLEVGFSVQAQGCGADSQLSVIVPQRNSGFTNAITSEACVPSDVPASVCEIGALDDGSYEFAITFDQCDDIGPDGSVVLQDQAQTEPLDEMSLRSFCTDD